MESEEQNDYSESTSLKGYHNITEESNYYKTRAYYYLKVQKIFV